MDRSYRCPTHPLMILSFVRRLIFVLLLPVVRGILNYGLSGTLSNLLIWETVLAVVILIISFARWRRFKLSADDEFFYVDSGVLFTREAQVRLSRISCVYIERQPFTSIFGAVKVSIDTDAGGVKESDFTFFVSSKQVDPLCAALKTVTPKNRIYLCSTGQIALMSISNASALSGLLVAATVINNAGKLVGDVLEKRLFETLDYVTAITSRIIPPAATAVAAVLALGFCVSFTLTLFKHLTFVVRCNKNGFVIEQGLIWHKRSFVPRSCIGVSVVTMPPLLHIFRRCSLRVVASGYGKNNGENSVLFPVEKRSDAARSMRVLGIGDSSAARPLTLKIPKRAMWRAVFMPILWFVLIAAASVLGCVFFVSLTSLILILAVFLAIIDTYWLYMKIYHTRHGGASLSDGVRVYGFAAITLNNSYFERSKVDHFIITEGPYDRINRMCTLRVTMRGEKGYTARTTNLDKPETDAEVHAVYGV